MVITKKTRVKDITLLIPKNRYEDFIESVPPYPLEKPILSMTIGEFASIALEEDRYLESILKPSERAYIAFGRLHQYHIEMNALAEYMKRMQIKQTADEQAAGRGIDMPSFIERMLLDTVTFFHLHSMADAEKIPLADYLVVLKDQTATARYQRNYNKIIENKSKAHRKK